MSKFWAAAGSDDSSSSASSSGNSSSSSSDSSAAGVGGGGAAGGGGGEEGGGRARLGGTIDGSWRAIRVSSPENDQTLSRHDIVVYYLPVIFVAFECCSFPLTLTR